MTYSCPWNELGDFQEEIPKNHILLLHLDTLLPLMQVGQVEKGSLSQQVLHQVSYKVYGQLKVAIYVNLIYPKHPDHQPKTFTQLHQTSIPDLVYLRNKDHLSHLNQMDKVGYQLDMKRLHQQQALIVVS